jgi:hypothetical protein
MLAIFAEAHRRVLGPNSVQRVRMASSAVLKNIQLRFESEYPNKTIPTHTMKRTASKNTHSLRERSVTAKPQRERADKPVPSKINTPPQLKNPGAGRVTTTLPSTC